MSAINGIFYRDGRKVPEEQIKKMNNRLSHRGPDGSAIWCEGSVALGHQMLYTTPESLHEILPFEEDSLVITADARIDNRRELSKKLGIEDKEEVSDSYFILKTYQKWGEKCPEELLGDFAFVIWDKDKERIFCARDHMGVKPFYYYLDDEMFVFGTEIKALFCVSGIPRKLNESKVAFFLIRDVFNKDLTFYENIMCLPSAHLLTLNKEIKISRYWKLDPDSHLLMDSKDDYARAFRKIFAEAVRCRLRSNFPIGSELSGGLDSSSVVCMAKKILNEDKSTNLKTIDTFSRVFDETPESDERFYIKKVIDAGGINPHFINVDNISPLKDINHIFWHQDQPFNSPHMTKQIKTYEKINKEGISILLSGEGGDMIVSHGTNYLRELVVTFQWKILVKEINGRSQIFNENKFKILLGKVIVPLLSYNLKRIKIFLGIDPDTILDKNFVETLKIKESIYNNYLEQLKLINSKEHHYSTITQALHEIMLGIKDRSVAGFNIEMRFPFYDKRLVEFCYSLPTEMKLKSGWSRYIMRIAMEKILPAEVQWRHDKADLSYSYTKNLLLFEKNTLKKLVYNDNFIKDYVNLEKLQQDFEKFESKGEHDPYDLWLVLLFYLWFDIQMAILH